MKTSPELQETLAKGAAGAREIINQTTTLIDDEWKRLKQTVEESENVPDGVKTAMERFDGAVDEMREFVTTMAPQVAANATRVARQAGVPVPDDWFPEDEVTVVEDTVDDAVEDTVDDAIEDAVVEDVDDEE